MSSTDGAALRVRFAGVTELARIVALVESAYRGPSSEQGWTSEAHLIGGQRTDAIAVRALMVSVRDAVLATGDRRDPLACCTVGCRDGRVSFGMFAVHPGAQGHRTGRAMLAAAERYAVERWEADAMHLSVIRQREPLIAWYERRGYRRTGETLPFPYGDERFGVPRRDDLSFVVLRRPLR